jgi:hypothetical protein
MELHSYFFWGRVDYATKGVGIVDYLGQFVCVCPTKEVWRLVPLYLMWCFWRERNARKLLLNMFNLWTATHHSLSVFHLCRFFVFILYSFLLGVLLYTPCVLELYPFAPY